MTVSEEIAGKQGRKGLKVVFTSDKKKSGGGAQCTAQCIDPAPTTTPTPGIVSSVCHVYFPFIKANTEVGSSHTCPLADVYIHARWELNF